MPRLKAEEDVRRWLKGQLKRDIGDEGWGILSDLGFVSDALECESGPSELLEWGRRLLRMGAGRQARKTAPRPAPTPGPRWELLRRLQAEDAEPWVRRFRETFLSDAALSTLDNLPLWAWRRNAPNAAPPVLGASVVSHWLLLQEKHLNTKGVGELLTFLDEPGAPYTSAVFVGEDGALCELKRLCRFLKDFYNWPEPDAVAFVLAGVVPPAATGYWNARETLAGRLIITLDIDAAMTPAQVKAWYRQIRQGAQGKCRHRAFSRKILALVEFVLDHPSGTWREKMHEWNRSHVEWAYDRPETFQRDYSRAAKKIMRWVKEKSPAL